MSERLFSSQQVAHLTGLTLRQIAYWRRSGLLSPRHYTRGGHARYDFRELLALRTAKQLLDARVSVQRIRRCLQSLLQFLPTLQQPLSELSLVVTGDVVLAFRDAQAFDALSGQEWVFSVAELVRDIEQQRGASRPEQGELFPDNNREQVPGRRVTRS